MSDAQQQVVDAVPKLLVVGGEWRPAASGGVFPVEDPSTGRVLCHVADAGPGDAIAALDGAAAVQEEWAETPPRQRGEILRRSFEILTERKADLALLMTLEMGKPLAESEAEVAYAAEFLRWFSEEAVRIDGRYTRSPDGSARTIVMHRPVGPCLLITPWNFPMAMGTRKIGPAVAAGCTMIIKPAEATPLSTLALAEILFEAGLPRGVVSVLTTSAPNETTAPLLADARLRKVSFTGSTEVGRMLVERSAPNLLRLSMELGGNAPFLVFDDADLDGAVDGAMIAKLRNMGESCVAANRFLVAEQVAEEFSSRLTARMGALRVGRGTEPGVDVGPLIDADQRAKVEALVADAIAKGGRCRVGGQTPDGPGYFYPPTVLDRVPPDANILREEVFGPVAPITTFSSEDEAIAAANDSPFGLVAYVFTSDIARAFRVVDALETGMVGVNQGMVSNPAAPFGGMKQSGFGREGGREGIGEYLEVRHIALKR